ncbi:MAG: nicotinamide mononucleotide transporter [Lachnospiraceae bacterium]|nr:nicotinamide mononucleotide transporter [Lachnospiraceae bacterium]
MNIIQSIKNLNKYELLLWMCSVLLLTITFIINPNKDLLNFIATIVGVTSLILNAKGDALGQVLMVIFSILYGIISFKFRYYGEMITYVGMTGPIAALSVVTWLRNPYSEREVKVSHMNLKKWVLLTLSTIAVTWLFYYILRYFDTPNLFFSTISITTSFAAATLTMLRSPYYAVFYSLNDIILIILWVLATLETPSYYTMILCFVVFLINDIYGYYSWRKMRKRQEGW